MNFRKHSYSLIPVKKSKKIFRRIVGARPCVDSKANRDYFSIADERKFQQAHRAWVEEELKNDQLQKNWLWSEAIAIGNDDFVKDIHRRLKDKEIVGKMVTCGSMTVLKEPHSSYNTLFDGKKAALSLKNTYRIDVI